MPASESKGLDGTSYGWLTPGRFALGLGLLIAATFPGVLFGGETFIIRDYGLFGFPLAFFHRECFWRGEWPLWNPFSLCGVPFIAQWNTLCLYPPSLIYLLLPLTWSLPFFCLAHMFWGGLGMYFLALHMTRNRFAAALAGIIFSFNGLALNFLMWPNNSATFSWLPWLLWLAPQGWREGGKKLAWAALAGSLQMLAGGPEIILFTWGLLFLLAGEDWIKRAASRVLIPLRLVIMGILVALVCAAQLLPFLYLAVHSQRDSGFGSSEWSMPAWGWANFLAPLFRMSPTSQGLFLQPGQYWTTSYYAGIGTLWLAIVALRRAKDWRKWTLISVLGMALLMALGDATPVYGALHRIIPGMGVVRYPVKFVVLILALAPMLAALGIGALFEKTEPSFRFEKSIALGLLVVLGALVVFDYRFPIPNANVALAWHNGVFRALFFLLMAGSTIVLMTTQGRRRIMAGAALLLLFWLDFVTHVPRQNPAVQPSVFAPDWARMQANWRPAPRLGESRAMIAPYALEGLRHHVIASFEENYLLNRLALLADCNLLDHVPQTHGFFSLTPAEINNARALPYVQTNREFAALMDFMAVAQITSPENPFAWTNRPTAMPIVTAGQQAVFADDQTAFGAFFQTNLDLREIVFLPPEARGLISATQQMDAQARITAFENQRVRVETKASSPSLVVISQAYYEAWKAYVDGKSTKLWRANYAFQAVEVPPGKHQLELRYEDSRFRLGLWISALGLVACAGVWMKAHLRAKQLAV